ncbi:MAG: MOSC domain-containing protein [Planctomycetes bacterium]|nr:MOSC domain-containing protein [Planctomycetota bacterium]
MTSDERPVGRVLSVNRGGSHSFSKTPVWGIRLLAGIGVEGDVHAGPTVTHRSRVARDPQQPNLRQVHLLHSELFTELTPAGFALGAGDIGENITTSGIDLLALPSGTRLHVGATAVIVITGLRTPCVQLDRFKPGLMKAMIGRDACGAVIRKSGVMGIVAAGGDVAAGDPISVELPSGPHQAMTPV